jgi:hypothetical protein
MNENDSNRRTPNGPAESTSSGPGDYSPDARPNSAPTGEPPPVTAKPSFNPRPVSPEAQALAQARAPRERSTQ